MESKAKSTHSCKSYPVIWNEQESKLTHKVRCAKYIVSFSPSNPVIYWEEKKTTDCQHQEIDGKKHIDLALRSTHHIHLWVPVNQVEHVSWIKSVLEELSSIAQPWTYVCSGRAGFPLSVFREFTLILLRENKIWKHVACPHSRTSPNSNLNSCKELESSISTYLLVGHV